MSQTMKFDRFLESKDFLWAGIFMPTFFCFLLPTNNSTQDGWCYAADAKWGLDLFMPHHLFYTAQLFLFSKLLPFYDILLLGKHVNAVYVGATLFIFSKLLSHLNTNTAKVNCLAFFVGVSFAVLRFGTENETYIAPIFYSLVGNYFFLKFIANQKSFLLVLSGFFFAFACLMHQVQFFWWLSILGFLLVNNRSVGLKNVLFFTLPALIVPLAYILVLVFYRNESLTIPNLIHFVFETFYTGTSKAIFDSNGLMRFFVAILRCFIQIHDSIFVVCQYYNWLYFLIAIIFIPLCYFVCRLLRSVKKNYISSVKYFNLYAVLLVMQLAFGLFCFGNSEMMVIIPFLTSILAILAFHFSTSYLFFLSTFVLLWNVGFGLILNNQIIFNSYDYWSKKSQTEKNAVFYLRYSTEIKCVNYYQTGIYESNCIFPSCKNAESTKKIIDSLLNLKVAIYTDYVNVGIIRNTASILSDADCKHFFQYYKAIKVDSSPILGQYETLYKLQLK
ncbi:MAG: hypothetical protein ACKVOU_00145 [Cytophagales bacterium]